MLNFGASKPRVKGGPHPRGPPLDPHLKSLQFYNQIQHQHASGTKGCLLAKYWQLVAVFIQNLLLVAEDASSKCFLILESLPVPSWVVLCRKSAALNSLLHWQDLYSSHLCFVFYLMSICLKFLLCHSFLLIQIPRSNRFQ